jgi:hypothetical protein
MMLVKWMGTLFAPRHPRHYTGRHRAPRVTQPNDLTVTPAEALS